MRPEWLSHDWHVEYSSPLINMKPQWRFLSVETCLEGEITDGSITPTSI